MNFEQWKLTTDPRFKYRELTQSEYDEAERKSLMGFKENYQQVKAFNLSKAVYDGRIEQLKGDMELNRMYRDWR